MNGCAKHNNVNASGSCGECGDTFCQDCLVFPFGPSRPAMCIGCALAFSGVRQGAARPRVAKPKVSWSERRRRRNLPKVPPVMMPERSLDHGIELGEYDHIELRSAS